jgi:hypothetical protein
MNVHTKKEETYLHQVDLVLLFTRLPSESSGKNLSNAMKYSGAMNGIQYGTYFQLFGVCLSLNNQCAYLTHLLLTLFISAKEFSCRHQTTADLFPDKGPSTLADWRTPVWT